MRDQSNDRQYGHQPGDQLTLGFQHRFVLRRALEVYAPAFAAMLRDRFSREAF